MRRPTLVARILIVERQLADLNDFKLKRRRPQLNQRFGHLEIERRLAQAPDEYRYFDRFQMIRQFY